MNHHRLMFLVVLTSALLIARQAAAQQNRPAGHADHAAASQPVAGRSLDPPLPEGVTLDEMLDYAAKPPPASFPEPVHDDAVFVFTQFELLEYRVSDTGRDELGWDAQGWIGSDDDKFWWKTEGEAVFDGGDEGEADVQALYAKPISAFWFLQAGVQFDEAWEPGSTQERFSAVLGLQGIAPYQFDLEPALLLTDDGDVLAQFTASYYLYLTQRLVLQPRVELRASAQDVPEYGLGAGLNSGNFDLRLLYEIRREFAPYVGVRYNVLFGETGAIAEQNGGENDEWLFVVGARITF